MSLRADINDVKAKKKIYIYIYIFYKYDRIILIILTVKLFEMQVKQPYVCLWLVSSHTHIYPEWVHCNIQFKTIKILLLKSFQFPLLTYTIKSNHIKFYLLLIPHFLYINSNKIIQKKKMHGYKFSTKQDDGLYNSQIDTENIEAHM